MDHTAELVAYSQVQRQSGTDTEIILQERRIHHAPDVRLRIAIEQRRGFQSAGCGSNGHCTHASLSHNHTRCRAISQRPWNVVRDRILSSKESQQSIAGALCICALTKTEITFRVGPCAAVLVVGHDCATESHGVIAEEIVDLIVDLE